MCILWTKRTFPFQIKSILHKIKIYHRCIVDGGGGWNGPRRRRRYGSVPSQTSQPLSLSSSQSSPRPFVSIGTNGNANEPPSPTPLDSPYRPHTNNVETMYIWSGHTSRLKHGQRTGGTRTEKKSELWTYKSLYWGGWCDESKGICAVPHSMLSAKKKKFLFFCTFFPCLVLVRRAGNAVFRGDRTTITAIASVAVSRDRYCERLLKSFVMHENQQFLALAWFFLSANGIEPHRYDNSACWGTEEERAGTYSTWSYITHIPEIMCCMDDMKVEIMYMVENKKANEGIPTLVECRKIGRFDDHGNLEAIPYTYTNTNNVYVRRQTKTT